MNPSDVVAEATQCCGGDCCAPLIDMSDVKLRDLLADRSPALARSVRRLVLSLDDPNGVISAFSSFVE
jgi:FXSXX-COOH protein